MGLLKRVEGVPGQGQAEPPSFHSVVLSGGRFSLPKRWCLLSICFWRQREGHFEEEHFVRAGLSQVETLAAGLTAK